MMNEISVVAVDDHSVITHGIEQILSEYPNINVVGRGCVGDDIYPLLREHNPNVLILDLNMPQCHDGEEGQFKALPTIAQVIKQYPDLAIIILTNYYVPTIIQGALELGVKGYFLKSDHMETALPPAILKISKGGVAFSDTVERNLFGNILQNKSLPKLTKRHVEVLSLLALNGDASNAELANDLGIAEDTIKHHLTKIFSALGVTNRTSAIIRAAQTGIISIRHV